MELLCDGHHGVYIPQIMARRLFDAGWFGVELEKVIELEVGPYDNEWYDDIWNDILNSAQFRDESGVIWYLHHGDDLWAVTADEMENMGDW